METRQIKISLEITQEKINRLEVQLKTLREEELLYLNKLSNKSRQEQAKIHPVKSIHSKKIAQGGIPCWKCGHPNKKTRDFCSNCDSML